MNRLSEQPHFANVRKEIINNGESVPVGDEYYGCREPLPYRWLNDTDFQVYHNGVWKEACSIDWDFEI